MKGVKYSNLRFSECNKTKFEFIHGNMLITLNLSTASLLRERMFEPINFVFDTGSSITMFNRGTFTSLGYVHCQSLGKKKVFDASGNVILLTIYEIPGFTLAGGIKVVKPEICVPDNPDISGSNILGQNVIRKFHYCVNTVDNFLYFENHSNPAVQIED